MQRFLLICSFLWGSLLPIGLTAQFRFPAIVSPDGIPANPVAFQLTRDHWGLHGPVKQTSEYLENSTEEERKMYYDRTKFNAQGLMELDEVGGPYGYRRFFYSSAGTIRYGDFQLKLNASGQPLSAVSKNTNSNFSYTGNLLTGVKTIYREQIENMDGTKYISSENRTEQYNYDGSGRLTQSVKVVNEQEVYRINYYYNALGQLDSLSERGLDLPEKRFTFSYRTENGNKIVRYTEHAPSKIPMHRGKGEYVFTSQGWLISVMHSQKQEMLLKNYTLDQYGNWTKMQERSKTDTYKDWQSVTTIRTITYF